MILWFYLVASPINISVTMKTLKTASGDLASEEFSDFNDQVRMLQKTHGEVESGIKIVLFKAAFVTAILAHSKKMELFSWFQEVR